MEIGRCELGERGIRNPKSEYLKYHEIHAKLSKKGGSCHPGQAKRDPESKIIKEIWFRLSPQ
jgi:hypothetical protein